MSDGRRDGSDRPGLMSGATRRCFPGETRRALVTALRKPAMSELRERCGQWESDRIRAVYTIHATKKLLDRLNQPVAAPVAEPTTALGNWYATIIFWKPQVALLVNEYTLFPVVTALAPAASLATRFPGALHEVLTALGIDPGFVDTETRLMTAVTYAKTDNRSVVGIMNEFTFLARHGPPDSNLIELSLNLASTPCSPLYKRHISPDRELQALVETSY